MGAMETIEDLTEQVASLHRQIDSLTPSPRPASELTPERLEAWEWWMVGNVAYDTWWELRASDGVRVQHDAGVYFEVYPVRPDLSKGPIPATWEEVDAAVRARRPEPPGADYTGRQLAAVLDAVLDAVADPPEVSADARAQLELLDQVQRMVDEPGPWLTEWPAELPEGSVWEWESQWYEGESSWLLSGRVYCKNLDCSLDEADWGNGDRIRRRYDLEREGK